MKIIIAYVFFITAVYTSNRYSISKMTGRYWEKTKDLTTLLVLKSDSTFTYEVQGFEYNPKCEGKWRIKEDKEIQVNCSGKDSGLIESILPGNMGKDSLVFQIISLDTIELNGFNLIREK